MDDERNPLTFYPKTKVTWLEKYVPNNFLKEYLELFWIKDFKEFVNHIENKGLPEYICFDNDLGNSDKLDGIDCAKWLFNYCIDNDLEIPDFSIQSANPIASIEIKKTLIDDFIKYKSLK